MTTGSDSGKARKNTEGPHWDDKDFLVPAWLVQYLPKNNDHKDRVVLLAACVAVAASSVAVSLILGETIRVLYMLGAVIFLHYRYWDRLVTRPDGGRGKTWKLFLVFPALVIAEQSFIRLYLDAAATRQDETFAAYIASLGPPKGRASNVGTKAHDCEFRRIAAIYSYRICVYHARAVEDTGRTGFTLRIQKPASYFSLLSWSNPDRIFFDGASIFYFDSTGKILMDHRK